ncbi:MAG: hypothetical protein E6Q50_00890 [Lysobacter sp.]|nr:MAG: hypothetical protein E6Q50_00890 [Lysobacter sp.]
MNTMLKSLALASACCLLAVSVARSERAIAAETAAGSQTAAERPTLPGEIGIAAAGNDDIAGTVRTAVGALSFRTESRTAAGQRAAVGAAPARVSVRLEINGAVLDHEMDYAAGTLTVRAAERVVVADNDRDVLRSFRDALGRELSTRGDMRTMAKSHDLLWRLAEMYSEVPLGRTFEGDWVIRRSSVVAIAPQTNPTSTASGANPLAAPRPQGEIVIAACSDQGGNSFTNLHAIVDVCDDDRVFYRASAHDYCPTHGYSSKSVAYGCGASSCPGRCGAGCGAADGLGAWYQDCLDHDICNRDHNSQLGGCGDEWTEAADDYALGAISCYTTCH